MKRKILILALILMLVASMAIPALAVSYSGSYGGAGYTCTLTTTVSKSTATMTYELSPFTLNIYVRNQITIQPSNKTVYGPSYHYSGTSPVSGTANNYYYDYSSETVFYGEVKSGTCDYYVGVNKVRTLTAYP